MSIERSYADHEELIAHAREAKLHTENHNKSDVVTTDNDINVEMPINRSPIGVKPYYTENHNKSDVVTIDNDINVEVPINRPPIGVKPYYTVAVPRVNDLLSAIGRYVNVCDLSRWHINAAKLWAKELEEQLDLIDTMLIYKE